MVCAVSRKRKNVAVAVAAEDVLDFIVGTAVNEVAAIAIQPDAIVIAVAAEDRILPFVANKDIIASATLKFVISETANETVIAAFALQRVIAIKANDDIILRISDKDIDARCSKNYRHCDCSRN